MSAADTLDFAFKSRSRRGKVVDLVPEIKKKKYNERHRWEITNDDLDRIAADIWPAFNGPAAETEMVRGMAPKKPPLTSEAGRVLAEVGAKIGMISYHLTTLSEAALKGLAFEVRRTEAFGEERGLWRGLAEECDHQREILRRHRTGKGVWYAVIEMLYAEDQRTS